MEGIGVDLVKRYQSFLKEFKELCEEYKDCEHKKNRKSVREFLNDWDAIFFVLSRPGLALTNNEAERALRHWVILRQLSFGTCTPQGSRVFALLASVLDTCRRRSVDIWKYLAEVVSERHKGNLFPPLPQ